MADLVTGVDVAEVVLGHVGIDPEVVHGDQGHGGRAGLCILPDIGSKVRHQSAGGRDHDGALEVELGFLDRRARTEQLRVAFALFTRGLLGFAQISLGRLHLAGGLEAGGLRILDPAQGDRAWIFLVDLFQTRRILAGVDLGGHGRLHPGPGRHHRRVRAIDRAPDRLEVRVAFCSAMRYGVGSMSNRGCPCCTSSLFLTYTFSTMPGTSAATGTTKAWIRACEV